MYLNPNIWAYFVLTDKWTSYHLFFEVIFA